MLADIAFVDYRLRGQMTPYRRQFALRLLAKGITPEWIAEYLRIQDVQELVETEMAVSSPPRRVVKSVSVAALRKPANRP